MLVLHATTSEKCRRTKFSCNHQYKLQTLTFDSARGNMYITVASSSSYRPDLIRCAYLIAFTLMAIFSARKCTTRWAAIATVATIQCNVICVESGHHLRVAGDDGRKGIGEEIERSFKELRPRSVESLRASYPLWSKMCDQRRLFELPWRGNPESGTGYILQLIRRLSLQISKKARAITHNFHTRSRLLWSCI